MSEQLEERLRDAYQGKTAQLTEARLNQLTATREQGLDDLIGTEHTAELPIVNPITRPGRRQHRWIAPTLAAAAIAAVTIGAVVIATDQPDSRPRPNPPASHVSSPSTSFSTSTPAPSASQTQTVTAPPYLPAGQTGTRDQVPWSIVGSGWRLIQPEHGGDYKYFDPDLYLYDPAGGRYLITSSLPTQSVLQAWSPDGRRALIQDNQTLRQLDLHTGHMVSALSVPNLSFRAYTRPKGLAILLGTTPGSGPTRLVRYSLDGALEQSYPPGIGGNYAGDEIYTPDGSQFVTDRNNGLVLMGNNGQLIRQFAAPAGYERCSLLKWWTSTAALELCTVKDKPFSALFAQPVTGNSPSPLTTAGGKYGMGYSNAWQLSNGEVLLENNSGCGGGGYAVLATDGTIRALRLPAGVTAPGTLFNMDGDLATFLQHNGKDCTENPGFILIDYNMVTGATRTLLDGLAVIVNWPSDQR